MNKNATIVVIILILVIIAGYFVWLSNEYQPPQAARTSQTETVMESTDPPFPTVVPDATLSATPQQSTASGSKNSATPSGVTKDQ